MAVDILTIGEALVEIMRTEVDQPLDQPAPFTGPYPSGAPFIFAVQVARLGLRSRAVGSVGDDAFGRCLRQQLDADGVDAGGVRVLDTHPTGTAFIAYNSDSSRNFVFSLGAGAQLHPDMLDADAFDGLRCLHLMGSTLSISADIRETCEAALQLAIDAGALISFDPNLRPELLPPDQARQAFAPFIAAADVLIPTAEELRLLMPDAADDDLQAVAGRWIADKPERVVVVTRGAGGCTVYHDGEPIDVAGFQVDEVDPTGAGDCFDAGFLVGRLNGASLYEAARLANACGALAVTKKGPMAGAATLDRVRDFMREQTSSLDA